MPAGTPWAGHLAIWRKSGGPGSLLIGIKILRGVLRRGPIGPRKRCHHRINPQPPAAMKTLSQIPAKNLVEVVIYAHVAIAIQILTHLLQ